MRAWVDRWNDYDNSRCEINYIARSFIKAFYRET